MNAKYQTVLIAMATVALAGCASSGGMAARQAQPQYHAGEEVDLEYVAAVENVARSRGVDVRWVHPPTKRPKLAVND